MKSASPRLLATIESCVEALDSLCASQVSATDTAGYARAALAMLDRASDECPAPQDRELYKLRVALERWIATVEA